jgi:uncharacterized membrane protein YphA (DoxX/SURF4 family)
MGALLFMIGRFFLAILFISTAIGKLLDNRGFALVIDSYQLGIPESNLLGLALSISLLELIIGINILFGRALQMSIFSTLIVHLSYAVLAFFTLQRGISLSNCGCFGIFWARPLKSMSVVEDLVLAGISLTCWLLLRKRRSV